MPDKISEDQYQKLLDVIDERRTDVIVKTFEDITGIVVKPYTAYYFFDVAGNYLGDLEYNDVREILKAAGIEVKEK